MGWDTDAPAHVQGPLAEPALCVSLVVVRVASSQGVWGRGEKTAWYTLSAHASKCTQNPGTP